MTKRGSVRTIAAVLFVLLGVASSRNAFGQAFSQGQPGVSNLPDCNNPSANEINCVEPTKAIIKDAYQAGYTHYIGHAEPTAEFFSTAGASGSNMQWKIILPATEPTPTQNGTDVANFELYSTFWLGVTLCDPNSNPFGSCVATSDSNNPSTAGAAFLELQFYPPGLNCSNTQWCVRLHINTLQNNTAFQKMNCLEPTTEAYVTLDGTVSGTQLLMSDGDAIIVTINDTASGLETFVNDVTSSTTGFMVASAANGFVHNSDQSTCAMTPFNFHIMYMTASPGQTVPWAATNPNVAFDPEIGHFELCGNASCSILPDPPDASETTTDDTGCQTVRGIGGCFGADLDHDGTPYQADWPDGSPAHPASIIVGSPNDTGVGPLSALTTTETTYDEGYNTITFVSSESIFGNFYPFYSQAGTGPSCVLNFGNDIPGTTTNDFGQATQYGTTITNPCLPAPDLTVTKTHTDPFTQGDVGDTFTITVSNAGGSATSGTVTLTDLLPASLMATAMGGAGWTCTVVTVTCTNSNVLASGASYPPIVLTVNVASNAPLSLTNTAAVSGGGEASNVSGNMAVDNVTVRQHTTTTVSPETQDYDDTVTLQATVVPAGVAGSVQFLVNGSSVGAGSYNSGTGDATLSYLIPLPAGSYSLEADFTSSDPDYLNSSAVLPTGLTVTHEEDTTKFTASSPTVIADGHPTTFSATLLEDGVTPIKGRTITIAIGSQSCSAGPTDSTGTASCVIIPTLALGPGTIMANFAGDAFYLPSSTSESIIAFAFLNSGSMVVGNLDGNPVEFWGAQWANSNSLSGGPAPNSFKGFASIAPQACGGGWISNPGNSSGPPATLPSYMGVIVSSTVVQSGSTISGDVPKIVVVQTNPGYGPNPGHAGTGSVVATFCGH
jgi:uncharacterized repeat protein (TIGR01451 family)